MMAAVTVAAPCLCAITITLWRRCSKPLMQVAPEAEAQPAKLFMPKDHQKPEGGPDVRNHHHANTPLWIRFLPSYSGVLSHCVFVVCFVPPRSRGNPTGRRMPPPNQPLPTLFSKLSPMAFWV